MAKHPDSQKIFCKISILQVSLKKENNVIRHNFLREEANKNFIRKVIIIKIIKLTYDIDT
jgi:hypothetical protein